MRILAFSDLHCDLERAADLVERSADVDVVIGAGDFASVHSGLTPTIAILSGISRPTVLVPGNNERLDALEAACSGWEGAAVLHGSGAEIAGVPFFGLGGGIPVTPWDWSFDVDEEDVPGLLEACPPGAVLVLHSPPRGHVDVDGSGRHLGSEAIASAIAEKQPRVAVCGHIHDSWGADSTIGSTRVMNLGPAGTLIEI